MPCLYLGCHLLPFASDWAVAAPVCLAHMVLQRRGWVFVFYTVHNTGQKINIHEMRKWDALSLMSLFGTSGLQGQSMCFKIWPRDFSRLSPLPGGLCMYPCLEPCEPHPWCPLRSLRDVTPQPRGEAGAPSVSLCHSLLSSHGAFFALLTYSLPCYAAVSSLSLSHSTESSLGATATSHPWNRHAQYVFG